MAESFQSQFQAEFRAYSSWFFQGLQQRLVEFWFYHNRNILIILGGSSYHGRSPDINVLYGFFQAYSGPADGFPEGIEVYCHYVNRADIILLQLLEVFRYPAGQNSSMDFGMQSLNPAIQDFRKTGYICYLLDLNPGFLDSIVGSTRRNNFIAQLLQSPGKIQQTFFIGYTD